MSAWWWTGLMLVAVVAVGVCRWRDARLARHEEWIRQILGDDRQVAELEAALRTVAREHKQNS